ncbi:DedA family protein [Fulvimarina sp. 2208YS6-2-32]|uniref:DedA family protein n=1 Tax=Fulvimarina uroteuthidis TaxID=3098149 RepID=A0ABU5I813_9HYPH|nr:DedA family protein [Fulvimarina sp. 2208YS6-2-32]MDY8110963.1 DedA family protein [Fulvimarina sp. 2208YS6-2-32]
MFDWITGFITQSGYLGIAFLMFAENIFPPIPSELIMPLAGFSAAEGDLSLIGVLVAGTIGSLLGALPWYYAGYYFKLDRLKRLADRHGRWLTMTSDDVDTASSWFRRYGASAVFFGRLIPTVRTLISVPAGINRMGMVRFLAWSALGTVIWTTFLTLAGYVLQSQYDLVAGWLDPVTQAVVAFLVLGYVYRVVTFGRRQKKQREHRTDEKAS